MHDTLSLYRISVVPRVIRCPYTFCKTSTLARACQLAAVTRHEVEVRHDGLGPEDDLRPVLGHVDPFLLRGDPRHVVRQTQKMLLVVVRAVLADHFEVPRQCGVLLDRAAPLYLVQHVVGDGVDEDDRTLYVELLRLLADVVGNLVGVRVAARAGEAGDRDEQCSKDEELDALDDSLLC
jgi:hypothetical protein